MKIESVSQYSNVVVERKLHLHDQELIIYKEKSEKLEDENSELKQIIQQYKENTKKGKKHFHNIVLPENNL